MTSSVQTALWKPLCGGEDENVPGSCLELERDHWFPPHICPAVLKHPQRFCSPRINLPLLSFIYIAVYARPPLLLFLNRHEVILPVTGSCPAVLGFHAQEVSSLRQPSRVNQANLRESLVNNSPQTFSQLWLFGWIRVLRLSPPVIPLQRFLFF